MSVLTKLRSGYEGLIAVGENLQSLFLLGVRLFWGYQFLISGVSKLKDIAPITAFFQELDIFWPQATAYAVSSIEAGCGALLLVGLFSRLAAIPLIAVMVGAYLTADFESVQTIIEDPINFIRRPPFTFLLVSLVVFIFGPGKFSLDYLLLKFFGKEQKV